jgi:hypothetical protein
MHKLSLGICLEDIQADNVSAKNKALSIYTCSSFYFNFSILEREFLYQIGTTVVQKHLISFFKNPISKDNSPLYQENASLGQLVRLLSSLQVITSADPLILTEEGRALIPVAKSLAKELAITDYNYQCLLNECLGAIIKTHDFSLPVINAANRLHDDGTGF